MGEIYQPGESFMDDCNTCVCSPPGFAGQVQCTLIGCGEPVDAGATPDAAPTHDAGPGPDAMSGADGGAAAFSRASY